jgi:hypothetical protein
MYMCIAANLICTQPDNKETEEGEDSEEVDTKYDYSPFSGVDITSVLLNRADTNGLFDSLQEIGYLDANSPLGTRWRFGTGGVNALSLSEYVGFGTSMCTPCSGEEGDLACAECLIVPGTIAKLLVVGPVSLQYFTVTFESWSSLVDGAGFQIRRRLLQECTLPVPPVLTFGICYGPTNGYSQCSGYKEELS